MGEDEGKTGEAALEKEEGFEQINTTFKWRIYIISTGCNIIIRNALSPRRIRLVLLTRVLRREA